MIKYSEKKRYIMKTNIGVRLTVQPDDLRMSITLTVLILEKTYFTIIQE
jgi:hypothetical protein